MTDRPTDSPLANKRQTDKGGHRENYTLNVHVIKLKHGIFQINCVIFLLFAINKKIFWNSLSSIARSLLLTTR